MVMAGFYLVIDVSVLLLWPGDDIAALPFVIGGFLLKVAGAWLGAGGTAPRLLAKTDG